MKVIHILFVLLAIPFICFAQEKWELKKNENGIAVYTAKLENEKFKEIRVICEFNATQEQLTKELQNVDHHKDWVFNLKKSYLINRKSKDTVIYYSEISLPWPISNRDMVMQQVFLTDSATNSLKVEVRSLPKMLPNKANLIRIPFSLGLWHVTSLPGDRIRIVYTFRVDPGGSLPAWLVNFLVTAGPYNTFKNLKNLLEKKKV